MSDIRDVERMNARKVETMNRKTAHELKRLEASHGEMKAEAKKAFNADVVELQDQHRLQVESENHKKEKVLAEMRAHLQNTESMTDKQLKALETETQRRTSDLSQKNVADRERISGENELYLEEMNDRFNTAASKINRDGKSRLEAMSEHNTHEYSDKSVKHNSRMNLQAQTHEQAFKAQSFKNEKMKSDQDLQFKKERMAKNVAQNQEMEKTTKLHSSTLETKDKTFKKELRGQEIVHEGQYTKALDKESADYKKLADRHKLVIEKFKTEMASEIEKRVDRSDDPFFQFIELRPKLKETETGVVVTVEIPEHSKNDLSLTLNSKEVIVGLNRRYADQNKQEDGTINKVNKVETLTTRLQSSHVLNPKTLKSTYENGVMTYEIKKA